MQVPLLLVYACIHKFYTRSYIELQRIDAVSPLHCALLALTMGTLQVLLFPCQCTISSSQKVT